ncbi:MAG: cobyrinate a,c-diamide synthase [Geminicoccaceae bacterium]|nr:cobyrinate a,c-diamide synthase [Geminicoccaceae bacterium]
MTPGSGRPKGFVVSAPSSACGKTVLTLGILRGLKNRGHRVRSAKSGPDYIDPRFHEAASGTVSFNLDGFAMGRARIGQLASTGEENLVVVEGAMGLFDGAPPDGRGSTADVAAFLGLPVVLVVNAGHMSHSVAAIVEGFRRFREDVAVAAVILNRVGSARHGAMLRRALEPFGLPVIGAVRRSETLDLPSRHLGLVQAGEHGDMETFIARAADHVEDHLDLDLLLSLARPLHRHGKAAGLPPLGQKVAIASDRAFSFIYQHWLEDWRSAGCELTFFSPLADEAPAGDSDAVFLPGGYPELHAGRLARAGRFRAAMLRFRGLVYGECGGYMTLGRTLTDESGEVHPMLGMLPVDTSFAERRRHLGYRLIEAEGGLPWSVPLVGHEFHYATTVRAGPAAPLFRARDAEGNELEPMGLRAGRVMGSFAHVIDAADGAGIVASKPGRGQQPS